MRILVTPMLSAIAACAMLGSAGAANIYKWVDADGITHYSDAAPETAETELVDVPAPNPRITDNGATADSDYYSISNQWQRMNRERLQREKLEVERARIRAAQKAAEPTTVYVQQTDDSRYVPIYHKYGHRKHHRYKRHYHRPGIEPYRPAPSSGGSWPTQ